MPNLDSGPPDGGYGWIIVIACILMTSSLTPLLQCFGIIYENALTEMGVTAAQISFLLHLNSSIMCSLGILSGPMLKKYNYKQTSLYGCILVCGGIIITSFTRSYGQLIFTIGVLIGTGQGILMPSTAMAVNTYFKKQLTLAVSFTITGAAVFSVAAPHICNYLLNLYGKTGTVLLLGAFSLHAIAGALLLRPIKIKIVAKPENPKMKDEAKNLLPPVLTSNTYSAAALPAKEDDCSILKRLFKIFDLELLKDRTYIVVIVGMSISYVAELNFLLMSPFVLSELANFTRADIALAMSIIAASDIVGRLCIPLLSHRTGWPPKVMYACSLAVFSCGRTALISFSDVKYIVLASCGFLGLAKGARAVYQALILPCFISLEKLPSAMGFLMVLNGILSLIIGPFIGAVHDLTNSYVYALHTATVLSMFCIVFWIADYCERNFKLKIRKPNRAETDNEDMKTGRTKAENDNEEV